MKKFLHMSSKNSYLYKNSCKKCINSERIELDKRSFYKCKKNIGIFPVSAKFIECKSYNK